MLVCGYIGGWGVSTEDDAVARSGWTQLKRLDEQWCCEVMRVELLVVCSESCIVLVCVRET